YTYVDNSPTNYSDPTGHAKQAENPIDGEEMVERNRTDLDAFAGSQGLGGGGIDNETGMIGGGVLDGLRSAVRAANVKLRQRTAEIVAALAVDPWISLEQGQHDEVANYNYATDLLAYVSGASGGNYFQKGDFNDIAAYQGAVWSSRNFEGKNAHAGVLGYLTELAEGTGPKRNLHMNEVMALKLVFGQSLPYNKIGVFNSNLDRVRGRGKTAGAVTSGSWNIHLDQRIYAGDMSFDGEAMGILAHEATHVWQYSGHRNAAGYFSGKTYPYSLSSHKLSDAFGTEHFSKYGVEQQAAMVEDIFRIGYGMAPGYGTFIDAGPVGRLNDYSSYGYPRRTDVGTNDFEMLKAYVIPGVR
ncbi:MAG: hypothetical protein ABJA62_12065, partial [Luteimonas sp.]